MATNTEQIRIDKLTIKYSPRYPIGAREADRLVNALDLARFVVAKSINIVRGARSAGQQPVGANANGPHPYGEVEPWTLVSLDYHFGMSLEGDRAAFWASHAGQIALFYSKILTGLRQNLTIADAYSTTISKGIDKGIARWRQGGRSGGDDGLLDLMEQGALQGFAKAAETKGFVSPKKSFMASLTQDQIANHDQMKLNSKWDFVPHIDMAPEDYGSIHINFQELLRPEKGVSDLRIARTIIHEASHKFCNTQDYAYAEPVEVYDATPAHQKIWNADSYAFGAVSLYRNITIQTDSEMALPRLWRRFGGGSAIRRAVVNGQPATLTVNQ